MRGSGVVSQARSNQSHAQRKSLSVSALGLVGPWLSILRRWIRHVQSRLIED